MEDEQGTIEYIGCEPALGGVCFHFLTARDLGGDVVETVEDSFTLTLAQALELQEELAAAIAIQMNWQMMMVAPDPTGN